MHREGQREKPPVLGTPPPVPADDGINDPLVGRLLDGKYRIGARIAVGAMGKIYRATQEPLHRVVAVKILSPSYAGKLDPNFEERFYLEASEAAALKHPNTVTIHDYGRTEDGLFYIVMELVEGKTLSSLVRETGGLPALDVVRIASKIARSLREAHERGVVHRDLKPENIMITEFEEDSTWVKVLDFGLVKVFRSEHGQSDKELTNPNLVMGSPRYMSPEQARNRGIGPASDIYSLGIIMFLALTGTVPFGKDPNTPAIDIIDAHLKESPPKVTDVKPGLKVPSKLVHIIDKCLRKNPRERFRDMDELLDALEEVERHLVSGRAAGRLSKTLSEVGGGRWFGALLILSMIFMVIAVATLAFLVFGGERPGGEISVRAPIHGVKQDSGLRTKIPTEPVSISAAELRSANLKSNEALGGNTIASHVRNPEHCTIVVTSSPSGAEVYESGKLLGKTPLTLSRKGKRGSFNVWLTGHEPADLGWTSTKECASGAPILLHANLVQLRKHGDVSVAPVIKRNTEKNTGGHSKTSKVKQAIAPQNESIDSDVKTAPKNNDDNPKQDQGAKPSKDAKEGTGPLMHETQKPKRGPDRDKSGETGKKME